MSICIFVRSFDITKRGFPPGVTDSPAFMFLESTMPSMGDLTTVFSRFVLAMSRATFDWSKAASAPEYLACESSNSSLGISLFFVELLVRFIK